MDRRAVRGRAGGRNTRSSVTAFYIAEDVTQLWFRLSTGADGVRIDDPALVEGEEAEGELLELGGELAAPEGLECAIAERSLTFSWDAVRNAKSYDTNCIRNRGVRVAEGSTPLTTAAVEGLEMGTTYRFSCVPYLPKGRFTVRRRPPSWRRRRRAAARSRGASAAQDARDAGLRVDEGSVYDDLRPPLQFRVGRPRQRGRPSAESGELRQQRYLQPLLRLQPAGVRRIAALDRLQILCAVCFGFRAIQGFELGLLRGDDRSAAAVADRLPALQGFRRGVVRRQRIDVAWGQHPSGNQLDLDYDAEESIELYVVYPIRCMEDSFNTAKLPEQYRRKYWSGWDWSDIGEKDIAKSRIRDCS